MQAILTLEVLILVLMILRVQPQLCMSAMQALLTIRFILPEKNQAPQKLSNTIHVILNRAMS